MESANNPKYRRGEHPISRANLMAPWKSGWQGNPHPPTGPRVTPRIKRMLDMTPAEFFRLELKTVADVVAAGYVFEAMQSGFDRGRQEVIERADGRVPALIEVREEPPAVAALRELQGKMRVVK